MFAERLTAVDYFVCFTSFIISFNSFQHGKISPEVNSWKKTVVNKVRIILGLFNCRPPNKIIFYFLIIWWVIIVTIHLPKVQSLNFVTQNILCSSSSKKRSWIDRNFSLSNFRNSKIASSGSKSLLIQSSRSRSRLEMKLKLQTK